MGYVEKKVLMEELRLDNGFSEEEVSKIDKLIDVDKVYRDTILKLGSINQLEKLGLRERLLEFCDKKGYFPKWVENAQKGLD